MSDMREEKESAEVVRAKYKDLCRELNMDRETEELSWDKFNEVSLKFSLEGDPVHWFCCSLYAACRESCTPTVGGSNAVVMGNCVSLNKLLRCCKMSIYEFITKIKNWHEMSNLSPDFLHQINKMERKFSITFTLFQRYKEIFEKLFQCPRNEKRNTKFRSGAKCSFNKLYDICWCLFLCAKNEKPTSTVDLVTSFHLLICSIDLIYVNVLTENRIDLINPDFEGIPSQWNTSSFDIASISSHCIIDSLCQMTQAIPAEAKNMKNNTWRATIETFFETKTIYGQRETFLGIIANTNYERNLKSLNCAYEQYVLSVGEFDERILANYRKPNLSDSVEGEKVDHSQSTFVCFQELNALIPNTPYTRKHSLPCKENVLEPVANATNNVKKLQSIANITVLPDFTRKAGEDTVNRINDKINRMSQEFHEKFPNQAEATNRFELAKSLYYYLLERIIHVEIKTKPNIDLKQLLDQDTFNATLIACSVELVLEAYNSQLKFPWILDCFSIKAFHFYKIIEIAVRCHENVLPRALIKHLNSIEETCLESLAWQKSSPVWEIIKKVNSLPTWSEVDVSNFRQHQTQLQSPMNSAYDTFNHHHPTVVSESTKRVLFNESKETIKDRKNDLPKKQIELNKRAGSLPIFLRKFYKLAWLRIENLCSELDISSCLPSKENGNDNSLKKIWTLFEYSITQRTELMQDRHLDQILMCAIYIYIKVGELPNKTFVDIMRFYRKQPQATSSTYREVLMDPSSTTASTRKYDDIICFYNTIYVQHMTPFALKFSEKEKSQHDLLLSPHPSEKTQTYPKKLSTNHDLYVFKMEKHDILLSPHITYEFCKSPAKDLHKMNEKVRGSKRFLPFSDEAVVAGTAAVIEGKRPRDAPYYMNTITGIIKDRQTGEPK